MKVKRVIQQALLVCLMLIGMCLFTANAFAATIGQQLTSPEAGWRRYDDTDSRIQYIGTGWTLGSNSN
ncbi:hypothetical protein OXPF_34680 [Oxobacter pfennigii]|uniref:Uncharacterized protein n=1 Tax=Oxobacter pfennigii TaxID=36849 RepID=A0A0P8YTK8_9CLOT|nr:hypothetical protein [Oxobacter pfennigii]KPU43036.1 hypothetical protein OXPF_34680 [Oxobacter pfennigii]